MPAETTGGRLLLLHTGGAKTGSSAAQNRLRAGAARLGAAGVAYRGAEAPRGPAGITSGNGPPLARALAAGDRAEAARLVGGFMGGAPRGLVSCEAFEGLGEGPWRLLLAVAGEAGLGLRVAHVARDPLALALSSYDQMVKRHGEARPLAEWAQGLRLRLFPFLRLLAGLEAEGALGLAVLRYEAVRGDVAGAVLGALGLDPRLLDGLPEGAPVNRSLTRAERRVMRRVNAALGAARSREVSDRLLAADPARAPEPPPAAGLAALLRERHGEDLAWANRAFFPEGGGLELPEGEGEAPEEGDRGAPEGPEAVALDWALAALAEAGAGGPEGREGAILRHLRAVRRAPPPPDPRLPPVFDPVAYLLDRPRLLAARGDPYAHWLRTTGRGKGGGPADGEPG